MTNFESCFHPKKSFTQIKYFAGTKNVKSQLVQDHMHIVGGVEQTNPVWKWVWVIIAAFSGREFE